MSVLVTGGAGFIGSHIVDKLVNTIGDKVYIIDDLSNGRKENINKKSVFHKTNICNGLEKIFKNNIDIVIHSAANISVKNSVSNPIEDAKTNILGSLNILENCRKYNVKKIIYLNSGGAIVGDARYFPTDEKHPTDPIAPYGVSKHTVEHYLEIYRKLYGLKYTSLRLSNIYGPRQSSDSEGGVIAIFIENLLKNKFVEIYGDGKQTRDFLFVEDVADASIVSIKNGHNNCFNISTGKETSIMDLFNLIKKLTNSKSDAVKKEARKGDIKRSVLDCKKADKILGWKAKTTLEQGLKKTINYYRSL